jgi:hypothetical protein
MHPPPESGRGPCQLYALLIIRADSMQKVLARHLQLSRSQAVLTHSHAWAPLPKTPHAAHSGPISAQIPLPTQRFFLPEGASPPSEPEPEPEPEEGEPEGHAPTATHWPLQTTEGVWQTQDVGLLDGKGVNPSSH